MKNKVLIDEFQNSNAAVLSSQSLKRKVGHVLIILLLL